MARTRPKKRFHDLLRCAAEEFIFAKGYARTQIENIAARAGVSKGTVYLCVQSKAALFDLALRYADAPDLFEPPEQLPIPTPAEGATWRYVSERLSSNPGLLELTDRLTRDPGDDAAAELEGAISALYRLLADNRWAIKLVDTSALDHPDLAGLWHVVGRNGITSLLEPFIQRRIQAGQYSPVPDIPVTARFVLESCMLWAVHIHWDPHPEPLNHPVVEDALVQHLSRGLLA